MNGNNSKTLVWDNIPEWAIFALEYGTREELFLSDEDKKMITKFIAENFPNGYTLSVDWESYKEFDTNPAFGKACKTYKVTFVIRQVPTFDSPNPGRLSRDLDCRTLGLAGLGGFTRKTYRQTYHDGI